ncbi:MAG: carboxypeptidase M32 [Chitinophagales bacterium]|nr:carboxypeptidase M32 [Chitinophagales bacterium]
MYKKYKDLLSKRADIKGAIALLSWDQEVFMPREGASFRAKQLATLSGIAHEMFTSQQTGELLEQLIHDRLLSSDELKNVKETMNEFSKSRKLSKEFVEKRSETISDAFQNWLKARSFNDFKTFLPSLEKLVDIKRKEAELIGFDEHPYDALLDEYEPDEKTSNISKVFEDLRQKLPPLLKAIKDMPQVEDRFLKKKYDKDKQWEFGLYLLKQMGYDFDAGRQDISEHPFTITFNPLDVRVTTRINENDFNNMTFSCIHEGGHALYEQGIPSSNYGLPSGESISLGVHESQSRLWENNIGRSLPYWKANYGKLQNIFPTNLGHVTLQEFYRAINKVQSSLIRTEADELTYHFHIMIRFEIEKMLIEGTLEAKDARDMWNDLYDKYLGVKVPDDKNGILQDIHWSHGSFGYFPTYSLGSFYAAQFHEKAKEEISDLQLEITSGNLTPLLTWLREKIHRHGKLYKASELCQMVTGEPLNLDYFMRYAEKKYMKIYGFKKM